MRVGPADKPARCIVLPLVHDGVERGPQLSLVRGHIEMTITQSPTRGQPRQIFSTTLADRISEIGAARFVTIDRYVVVQALNLALKYMRHFMHDDLRNTGQFDTAMMAICPSGVSMTPGLPPAVWLATMK